MRLYEFTLAKVKASKIIIKYCSDVCKILEPVAKYHQGTAYLISQFRGFGMSLGMFVLMAETFFLTIEVDKEMRLTKNIKSL